MKRYIIPILLVWVSFFLATACKEYEEILESRTITVNASFSGNDTRADIEQSSGSRDLITRWKEDDVIRIYLFQDGKGYSLDPVKVYNISSDGKRCSFGFKLPSDISIDHPYEVYGLCDAEGIPVEEDGYVLAKSQLKRMSWGSRIVPMWFHSTGGQSSIQADFRHLGTYEILHITNTSNVGVMFRHDGFDVEEPWYKSYENTPLKDDYDPTHNVEEPGDDAHSGSAFVPGKSTREYLSWYIPTGALINEAKLLATIDGKSITSVNTKSSTVRIQRGHVYHMYATWDGEELKFENGNVSSSSLVVEQTEIHFDDVLVGKWSKEYLTVHNNGIDEQEVKVAIDGYTYNSPFDMPGGGLGDGYAYKVIPAGESRSFAISFQPSSLGDYSGNAIVTSEGLDGWKQIVPLYGKCVEEQVDDSFHLSAYSVDVYLNDNELVEIHNGSGEYEVVNENPDIVEWDINGLHVAHAPGARTPGDSGSPISYDRWYITAKKLGNATLRLTDKETHEMLTLRVKVITAPSLTLESYSATMAVGEEMRIEILTGSEWYQASSDNESVVSAYKTTISESGGGGRYGDDKPKTGIYVILKGVSAGTTTVRVKDMSSYEEAAIQVVVTGDVAVPDAVDLGLSVKWASFNLGATKPEEFGDYYAWGETEPKDEYWWSNYKFKDNSYPFHILSDADDAARIKLGEGWRIPTKAEWLELIINCAKYRLEDNSWEFRAPNGNSIIIPAANRIDGREPYEFGTSSSYYWSSTVSKDGRPYAHLSNYSGYHNVGLLDSSYGGPDSSDGFPIRAVYGGHPKVTSIDVFCDNTEYSPTIEYPLIIAGSTITKSLTVYNEGDVDLTVSVTDPTSYGWWSSDSGQALTYYGILEHNKTFTLSPYEEKEVTIQYAPLKEDDNASGRFYLHSNAQEGTVSVYLHSEGGIPITQGSVAESVDLGLSVKWASWNLGASKETEGGNYYAWGETTPKLYFTWETYKFYDKSNGAVTKYNASDKKTTLDLIDDAAHINWGAGWRIPTEEEYNELIKNCTVERVEEDGVNGCRYTGPNGNSIFLPVPGYCYENNIISDYNEIGLYWFANIYEGHEKEALNDYIYEPNTIIFGLWGHDLRYKGLSIRPVYDDK